MLYINYISIKQKIFKWLENRQFDTLFHKADILPIVTKTTEWIWKKESEKQKSVCYKCQMFRMSQYLFASLILQQKKYNKVDYNCHEIWVQLQWDSY